MSEKAPKKKDTQIHNDPHHLICNLKRRDPEEIVHTRARTIRNRCRLLEATARNRARTIRNRGRLLEATARNRARKNIKVVEGYSRLHASYCRLLEATRNLTRIASHELL